MEFETSEERLANVEADLVALPVLGGGSIKLGPGASQLDADTDGAITEYAEVSGYKGEKGETLVLPGSTLGGKIRAKRVMLVGFGEPRSATTQTLREVAAAVVRSAKNAKTIATTIWNVEELQIPTEDAIRACSEGAGLAAYKFDRYKSSKENGDKIAHTEKFVFAECSSVVAEQSIKRARCVVDAVCWARDLVNEPAGSKPPLALAERIRKKAEASGLAVEVWDRDRLERERMGGVLGVGKGSSNDPCLLRLEYAPQEAREEKPLCLVGKGVVFDSGGLSLKPADGMETMKTDMSGAAAVAAAMTALQGLSARIRVIGFLPLVENMPSGSATKPGDVLVFRNQKTAEVLNTDAEGRLIMADCLALASETEPRAIVDLATLTGACMVALGNKLFGVMANDDEFATAVLDAASRAGERAWRLPLPTDYKKQLESEVADVKNIGSRYGGALTAGLFLQEFVGDGIPWAHLDIAGPARSESEEFEIPKGGTGVGVRTLLALIERME